jgi:hypothetical protein
MARFKQKEITITDVPADVVNHRVYYSDASPVDYNADFVELPASLTTIKLPDDVPDVMGKAKFYVGVSAINDQGHESDIGEHPVPFGFVAPPVPVFTVSDV